MFDRIRRVDIIHAAKGLPLRLGYLIPTALLLPLMLPLAGSGSLPPKSVSSFVANVLPSRTTPFHTSFNPDSLPRLVAQKERKVALVIGNGNYAGAGKLNNPTHDAEDVAKALRELGFQVILLKDASRQQMGEAIEQFNQQLRQGQVGLFYFAGHGVQVNGENYLIPIGAAIHREQDVQYEAVALGRILGAMEDAKNSVNMVLLDACRNNPYTRSWSRSTAAGGLAAVQTAPGTLISFATSPGKVANDAYGAGTRNSPYTASLLENIKTPNTEVEVMLKKVRRSVIEKTRGQQIPWDSSSLTGNFAFRPTQPGNRAEVVVSQADPTPPSASAPAPEPVPEPVARGVSDANDDLLLQLQGCKHQGETLRCELLVTDQTQNRQVCVYAQYSVSTGTNVIDTQGNQYKATRVQFGGNQTTIEAVCQHLSRGVGVKAVVSFENVSAQTDQLAVVEVIAREYGQRLLPFRFRNVPVASPLSSFQFIPSSQRSLPAIAVTTA